MAKRWRKFGLFSILVAGVGNLFSPALGANAATDPVQVTSTPALYPAWSSQSHYYVTVCNNTAVQLSVSAQSGVTVRIDGQAAKTGSFNATVGKFSVGQEFLITTSTTTAPYHIRCLPYDFPTWSEQRNGTPQSHFFVATPSLRIGGGPTTPYVAVFDDNGVPRWWMNNGTGPPPIDAKALPNGNLLWTTLGPAGSITAPSPAPVERNLDGTIARTYPSDQPGGGGIDFHDIQLLPNGNYLLVIRTKTVQADLSQCGAPAGTTGPVEDPQIEELDSTGHLVWTWDTYDHIPLTEVQPAWYSGCRAGDAYHFNAVEYFPTGTHHDTVLLSFRNLDGIYNIDIATKNILWKLGGSTRPESLTVLNDPAYTSGGGFGGQHDIRLFANNMVTLHDNGTDRSRPPRAVRYQIDPVLHTATLLEQVTDPAVSASPCCGSARKLGQGNWVVSWGGTGHIEELTPSGSIVFSLTFSGTLFSYRAMPVTFSSRYGVGPFWGAALTAGMNTQFPRPPGGAKTEW